MAQEKDMNTPLKVEQWPIERLVGYARNPRKNDEVVPQMVASFKEFGFRIPIIAKSDGTVVDGHLRLKAARQMGLKEVPVALADDLTDAQVKAFRLLANRSANWAEWDDDLLKIELEDLTAEGFDIDIIGFDEDELAELFKEEEHKAGLTDDDAAPEVEETPVTREGDIWICGSHRLMCGNSTSIQDMETLTAGARVDMWLTDPPYNVAIQGGKHSDPNRTNGLKIKNDSMGDTEFRQFLRDAYTAADAVMKPGAVFYIWHADSEGYNFRGAAADIGWKVRQCLIWEKNCIVMGRQDYQWRHEPCLYGWKDGAGHLWSSDRKQTTILSFDRPSRSTEHPTMKPVALFEYQLLNNTKGGDIVLDSFGGSGTTMIAAEKNGRIAYLMELDPRYCDVIVRRWQEFTGRPAFREGDGVSFEDAKAGA